MQQDKIKQKIKTKYGQQPEIVQNFMKEEQEQQISFEQLNELIIKCPQIFSFQTNQCELNDQIIELRDYKIKRTHYFDEDDIFLMNKQIHQNFRRGLAYINLKNEWKILRRGQKKFFDLNWKDIDGKGKQYTDKLNNYNIGLVLKLIEQNKPIKIYATEKANGENCQISYCKELDCWAISSKNVTLIAQNKKQLIQYQENKYNVALLIANIWFQLLENKNDLINEIKQFLTDFTMLGEFCGHEKFQHLIQYDKICIRFYSVVPKYGTNTCMSPSFSMNIFDQFGFERVKCRMLVVQGKQDLINTLQLLEEQISKSSVINEGEGNVVYFCNAETDECLSLAKLKTLEYRLSRKIREKLKLVLGGKNTKNKLLIKFQNECNQFPYFNDLINQKQYYLELCDKILTIGEIIQVDNKLTVQQKKIIAKNIRQQYLQFMNLIKQEKSSNDIIEYFLEQKIDQDIEDNNSD